MPVNLLVYFLLLALSAVGAYLLNNCLGYTPLLFLLLIAAFDAFCALYARVLVRACASPGLRQIERGMAAALPYAYENRGRLLVCQLRIMLRLTGPKGCRPCNGRAALSIVPKKQAVVNFSLSPQHIGVYTAQIRRAKVYGPLGLFCFRLPIRQTGTLIVTPAALPENGESPLSVGAGQDGSGDMPARDRSADNYNGVREYAPGDPMRSIHWKLTAHNLKLMTRLYENDREAYTTIAVDLRCGESTDEQTLCTRDRLCESAFAAAAACVGHGGKARLVCLEGNELRTVPVKSVTDLPEAGVALASAGEARIALTEVPGALTALGALTVVSTHLDKALAERLGERSGNGTTLFCYVEPMRFAHENASGFFKYLTAHDVSYTIAKAARVRQAPKECLRASRAEPAGESI